MARIRNVINPLLVARYLVFALFIICNAIICSVAVWNYSLVGRTRSAQVDVYFIFLGALSLVSIFAVVFTELLYVDVLTTRVWFECAWVALFWIMQLAGGAALIAIESDIPCSGKTSALLYAPCASERVLLAFTWTCTSILLIYLIVLVVVAASQHREDPRVWTSDVRAIRAVVAQRFPSAPNSPLTGRFKKRSTEIYAPRPARIQPAENFHHPVGLSADYQIEPFYPAFVAPEQMNISYSTDLPEAIPLPPLAAVPTASSFPSNGRHNMSLRPLDPPSDLELSLAHANVGLHSRPAPDQPSPLGDWPRRDIMQQPVKLFKDKRRSPPPSSFEFPKKHVAAVVPSTDRVTMEASSQPRPRRPSGPRQRLPSADGTRRPTPLDLSGISNYETRHQDDAV